jgi:xylulose-5-phosphate/fructose-6-phosphate phosphoketolase
MTVLNDLDRFHLALDAIARVPRLRNDPAATIAADYFRMKLAEHRAYVTDFGDDMPDVRDWRWNGGSA